MRILVVDDDAVYCSLVSKKLATLGATTLRALDGLSAWEQVQEEEFDLALIDLGLPGLDGISLIERLRHFPKTQQMPVMVVTGRDDREAIDEAFGVGATLFITKPINWSLLSYQINCVMRLTISEQDARESHQRAIAESRTKDTVIGRLNSSLRPIARELGASTRDLLTSIKSGGDTAALTAHCRHVLASATRLETGLANMAAFADAMVSQLEIDTGALPLNSVVAPVAQSGATRSVERNIAFEVDMPSAVTLRGSGAQLSLALQNLVDNAVRFAPANSVVRFSGQVLEDGSFFFSVDDDGCGIAPEKLVQLLTPHLITESEHHTGADLTGIGLAVAKRIAESHGGTLTIRSAVGRGTTAIIHLPADRISARSAEAA